MRLVSVQLVMSTVVLPALAVNVLVPSDNVAPTGRLLASKASVSLPSVSTSAELIVNDAHLRIFIHHHRGRYGQRRLVGNRRSPSR